MKDVMIFVMNCDMANILFIVDLLALCLSSVQIDGHVIQLMNDNLNNGLTEEIILQIFTDVCEAVAALHHSQPPVVHRDLKVIWWCANL